MATKTKGASLAPGITPNNRTVLILSTDNFEDAELLYPYYRIQADGYGVTVATPGGRNIAGKHGYPVQADAAIEDITLDDFDAVVIPGGSSPDGLRRTRHAATLVATAIQRGIPVAAICHGPLLLCSVPLALRGGRSVTSWVSIEDDLVNAGFQWVDEPVVHDRGVITSRSPRDLPVFCEALLACLDGSLATATPVESNGKAKSNGQTSTAAAKSKGKTAKTVKKPKARKTAGKAAGKK